MVISPGSQERQPAESQPASHPHPDKLPPWGAGQRRSPVTVERMSLGRFRDSQASVKPQAGNFISRPHSNSSFLTHYIQSTFNFADKAEDTQGQLSLSLPLQGKTGQMSACTQGVRAGWCCFRGRSPGACSPCHTASLLRYHSEPLIFILEMFFFQYEIL